MKNHWTDKKGDIVNTNVIHDQCMDDKLKQLNTSIYASIKDFVCNLENEPKIEDLNCGDIVIKDSGSLGFDVYFNSYKDEPLKKIFFLNAIAEQRLVSWLLNKHQNDEEWMVSAIKKAFPKNNIEGRPPTTENKEVCDLKIYYNTMFVPEEVLEEVFANAANISSYKPLNYKLQPGTLTGNIWENDVVVQTFSLDFWGKFTFDLIGQPDNYAEDACYNEDSGKITLAWHKRPSGKTKLVVSYEHLSSPQQKDCGSLDIFYNCQLIQDEVLDMNYVVVANKEIETKHILCHTPVIKETLIGNVYKDGALLQMFSFSPSFNYELKMTHGDWPDSYVKDACLNTTTGELSLHWFAGCSEGYQVFVSYEYYMVK